MRAHTTLTGVLVAALAMDLAGSIAVRAAETADEILRRADLVRGPDEPFTLQMIVTDYRGHERLNETAVAVNVHDYSRSLVEFVSPPRDAGRKLLRVAENMWVRIPTSRRAIRITPQQRLLGQASNADVMGTNYAADYTAQLLGEEVVASYEGTPVRCYKLELVRQTRAASYSRLIYWVERESFRPIRSDFYTQTGRLLKTAHFTRYRNALGALRPGRIVIVNAVNKEEFTVLEIVDYGTSSLPVSDYTQAALQ